MHLFFRYVNGTKVEAILLAASRNMIRVVVPGDTDTTEFGRADDGWTNEDGQVIVIDAIFLAAGESHRDFQFRTAARGLKPDNGLLTEGVG